MYFGYDEVSKRDCSPFWFIYFCITTFEISVYVEMFSWATKTVYLVIS